MSSKRKFSGAFKLAAVRRIQAGESVAGLARTLEVNPGELYRWCREREKFGAHAFVGGGHKRAEPDQVAELERKIGQQALEIDFLKRALQRVEEQRQLRALYGGARSTNKSGRKRKPDGV
jgi:transposase-like protein